MDCILDRKLTIWSTLVHIRIVLILTTNNKILIGEGGWLGLITFISFFEMLAAVDLCLFRHLLTTIGNGIPRFSMWERLNQCSPPLTKSMAGTFMQLNNYWTEGQTLWL